MTTNNKEIINNESKNIEGKEKIKSNDQVSVAIVKDKSPKKSFADKYRDNFYTYTLTIILVIVLVLGLFFFVKTDKDLPTNIEDVKAQIENVKTQAKQVVESDKQNTIAQDSKDEIPTKVSDAFQRKIDKLVEKANQAYSVKKETTESLEAIEKLKKENEDSQAYWKERESETVQLLSKLKCTQIGNKVLCENIDGSLPTANEVANKLIFRQ